MKHPQPTRPRDLAVLAVVVGVVCWLAIRQWYGSLPRMQWFVPLSLGVLAVAELISGAQLRARLRHRPGLAPVDPLVAARQLALAKASALVGAAVLGGWAAFLIYLLPRLSTIVAARGDALTAGVGVVCAALLVGGAMWLEFCCRTPKPPDDRDPDADERRPA